MCWAFLLFISCVYSSPFCSFLGSWNGASCSCEDGWTGSDCSKLNLKPFEQDDIASYFQGVHDPEYPTFGGNIYKSDLTQCKGGGGDVKYYWIGQTMGNRAGMSCWSYNAAGSIWESTSGSPLGPFRFISWLGWGQNPYNKPATEIPWLGNLRFTVETRLGPGATELNGVDNTFAFVAYGKVQRNSKYNQYVKASFAPPSDTMCDEFFGMSPKVNQFTRQNNVQVMTVAYKELPSQSVCEREVEIRRILDSKVFVPELNGFPRSGFVNTELTWQILPPKIPYIPKSDGFPVNPAPLYNNAHGLIQFNGNQIWPIDTGMTKGMYYRPLFIRWNNPDVIFAVSEQLAILALRADRFIWEADASYRVHFQVGKEYYAEDPWFFETENGFHVYTHDIGGCPKALRVSCGGSIHLSKRDVDGLMFENKWVDKPRVFVDTTLGLSAKTVVKQRPIIYFESGKPRVLLTGNIWPGEFSAQQGLWVSKQGASRCFAQEVMLSTSSPSLPVTFHPTSAAPTPPTLVHTSTPTNMPSHQPFLVPTLSPSLNPSNNVPTVSPFILPVPTASPESPPGSMTKPYEGKCRPQTGVTKKQCTRKQSACAKEDRPMKWSSLCGAGCKCALWCNYGCKSGCNRDPLKLCIWIDATNENPGFCAERATGKVGNGWYDCLVENQAVVKL